jgi:hypothetical protein
MSPLSAAGVAAMANQRLRAIATTLFAICAISQPRISSCLAVCGESRLLTFMDLSCRPHPMGISTAVACPVVQWTLRGFPNRPVAPLQPSRRLSVSHRRLTVVTSRSSASLRLATRFESREGGATTGNPQTVASRGPSDIAAARRSACRRIRSEPAYEARAPGNYMTLATGEISQNIRTYRR